MTPFPPYLGAATAFEYVMFVIGVVALVVLVTVLSFWTEKAKTQASTTELLRKAA
jgi:hypothetical protein